jgi:hypothetical protein
VSNAIKARIQGDDYQALFFWNYALKMFSTYSGVEKVVYEADNVKSFDDIVVYYYKDKPRIDNRNNPVYVDYFQVKFHVVNNDSFTWERLMDPAFINAKSVSILQRLHNVQKQYAINGHGARFYLVAPWPIHPDDDLGAIISNNDGEFRLDKLFDGRPRTKMAKIRQVIMHHLDIMSEDELKKVLMPFRIWCNSFNMQDLFEKVNEKLFTLGFKPIENNSIINPYIELIKEWNLRGIKEFSKKFIETECTKEGFYLGKIQQVSVFDDIGIRSFYRFAENMEDETSAMVCLLKYFNGRNIKDNISWNENIYPEVYNFLKEEVKLEKKYRLLLDTHLSIAFIAGYLLDTKSGIEIYPYQKTSKGRKLWIPDIKISNNYPDWNIQYIKTTEEEQDVALVINITHNILVEVKYYIKEQNLNISKIIDCSISGQQSNHSIVDGNHAKILSDAIARIVKKRSINEKRNKLHIFSAAPAAFMFFLGQLSRSFGRIIIYEYDFDGSSNLSYSPSFEIPL